MVPMSLPRSSLNPSGPWRKAKHLIFRPQNFIEQINETSLYSLPNARPSPIRVRARRVGRGGWVATGGSRRTSKRTSNGLSKVLSNDFRKDFHMTFKRTFKMTFKRIFKWMFERFSKICEKNYNMCHV